MKETPPRKSASLSIGERSPQLGRLMGVKVAEAAREHSLRGLGVRLGDSTSRGRARGRCGDCDCLGGSLVPSLAGCGEHRVPQQDRGCKHAFPAPRAPRSAHHRLGPASSGARAPGTPKPHCNPNFPERLLAPGARGSCGQTAPGRPGLAGEARARGQGCCGRLARAPPGAAACLKFLLSRCLLPAQLLVGFPHRPRGSGFPPSPAQPVNP